MKIKTILLAFVLISAADVFIVACCYCDTNPSGFYKICDIEAVNLDNSGLQSTLASDTVFKEAYAIELNFDITVNQQCAKSTPLLSGAYAANCDCSLPGYYIDNPIADMEITSTNDINSGLPAGTDLTPYFYLFDGFEYYPASNIMSDYYLENAHSSISYELRLMEYPEVSGDQAFVVRIELEDGTILTSQAPTIYLK